MISDWEYLEQAKKGDEDAADFLFDKYYKSLLRMTSLITGSIDSAKDIVQETFVKLINGKIKHHEGKFKTYINTIAYRLALKEKYRQKRNFSLFKIEKQIESNSPLDSHIVNENQNNVFQVIQTLKPNYKEIMILRFYGKHSYEEISQITEIPLGTVKSRIFYAVKECGIRMKKKGML
ncbi:MAG: RNA polymerase sigma factor [Melioribacteraceae bacterium]|nr:RNA polymerase sigma factor [Melioribacteraceae bacterium]